MNRTNKTRRLTLLAMLTAIAMVLSFVESRIPAFVAVPGVKVGLANIAIVFTLYKLGAKNAIFVSLVRAVTVSFLFGSIVSLSYSIAGAVLSMAVMLLLRKTGKFSTIGVSVAGGVMHNAGQILVACLITETGAIAYYLPVLAVSGTIAGVVIGVVGGILVNRIDIKI